MFFSDIPGKTVEKEALIRGVVEGKMPHAQLFLSKPGGGHLPLALAYASYILCQGRSETDSCGVCPSCIRSHKYAHADLHFAFPVVTYGSLERSKTTSNNWLKEWREALVSQPFMDIVSWQASMASENKQPNINKEECIQIVHKLGMKSFESDTKILILWMPEFLSKEGNRLLKLIEEPTPDTVIIMVADRQEDILNTIISRTQITKVPVFQVKEMADYLAAEHKVDALAAHQIAVTADGNMGRAVQMAHGCAAEYTESLFHWLRVAYKMEPSELSKWIDEMSKWGREGQKNFLEYGLHFFREYLFMLITGNDSQKLSAKEVVTAKKMQATISAEQVEKIAKIFDKSYSSIIRNANAKITFMADSLRIAYIMRNLDKEEPLFVT